MRERPDRFYQLDRQEDPAFDNEERLYRRFSPADWDDDDGLDVAAFELPDMSVNRQKYAQPQDVLWSDSGEFDGWGVAAFRVEDIPPKLTDAGEFHYEFRPIHRPEKRKYCHSEVWAFENSIHLDLRSYPRQVSRDLDLRFRERLRRQSRVVIRLGGACWNDYK